jgi:hypothetical protein
LQRVPSPRADGGSNPGAVATSRPCAPILGRVGRAKIKSQVKTLRGSPTARGAAIRGCSTSFEVSVIRSRSMIQLTLTPDERDLLVRMLNEALKAKRVEVHRSEFSRDFRHQLEAEETRIQGLLAKLAQESGQGAAAGDS